MFNNQQIKDFRRQLTFEFDTPIDRFSVIVSRSYLNLIKLIIPVMNIKGFDHQHAWMHHRHAPIDQMHSRYARCSPQYTKYIPRLVIYI